MTDDKIIQVTPNIQECLKILKDALQAVKDPAAKEQAEGALAYLEKTAAGESQPEAGKKCPPNVRIMQN